MRLLILLGLLGGTLWLIRVGLRDARRLKNRQDTGQGPETSKLVQDPVCKAFIPPESAVTWQHKGQTHHFCSDRCAAAYRDEHS